MPNFYDIMLDQQNANPSQEFTNNLLQTVTGIRLTNGSGFTTQFEIPYNTIFEENQITVIYTKIEIPNNTYPDRYNPSMIIRPVLRTISEVSVIHCQNFITYCTNEFKKLNPFPTNILEWTDDKYFIDRPLTTNKTWDNLFLPKLLKTKIQADLDTFKNSKAKYKKLGIQYQRTYLVHGCPGTGKTSFVKVLARELQRDVFVVDLQTIIKDETLRRIYGAIDDTNRPIIILLEDIDCVNFTHQRTEKISDDNFIIEGCGGAKAKVSLGTLLNLLNGIIERDNVIIVMTTNHKDVLDEALIRKGRVDMEIEFKKADLEQVEQIYYAYYEKEFKGQYVNYSLSPADVIELAQRHTEEQFLIEIMNSK